jgi:2-haloacid dehalogenase
MLLVMKVRFNSFRTVAFSNSSLTLISTQMKNAGLVDYFDDIISVEETGSFKPDTDVYKFASENWVGPLALCALSLLRPT